MRKLHGEAESRHRVVSTAQGRQSRAIYIHVYLVAYNRYAKIYVWIDPHTYIRIYNASADLTKKLPEIFLSR